MNKSIANKNLSLMTQDGTINFQFLRPYLRNMILSNITDGKSRTSNTSMKENFQVMTELRSQIPQRTESIKSLPYKTLSRKQGKLDQMSRFTQKNPDTGIGNNLALSHRVSSSLIGRGKKESAHVILLKSLSVFRHTSLPNNVSSWEQRSDIHNVIRPNSSSLLSDKKIRQLLVDNTECRTSFLGSSSFVKACFTTKKKRSNVVDNEIRISGSEKDRFLTNLPDGSSHQLNGDTSVYTFRMNKRAKIIRALSKKGTKKIQNSTQLLFQKALRIVQPKLSICKIRRGSSTYQVPFSLHEKRQQNVAIRWLLESAQHSNFDSKRLNPYIYLHQFRANVLSAKVYHRLYKRFSLSLAQELQLLLQEQGKSFEKRKKIHKLALENRTYSQYRSW